MEEGASQEILERLQWLLYFAEHGSASETCDHFDISRSTLYRWLHRFDPEDYTSLTDHPTRPETEHAHGPASSAVPTSHCPFCRLKQRIHRPSLSLIASLILLVFILNVAILLIVLPVAAKAVSSWNSNPFANISGAFQIIDK
ncbi:MAG: helix-turn-helix domain-containing protein [Candidatus Peribacteraceae bacterium]|nr:helix-turn-helix domain-containing protein [Candidatus Peribacteraceae bacterium]MDD5075122.1 helix-turn-helix domain-containing protein [Candidatus Peribacteraceae bacterium]